MNNGGGLANSLRKDNKNNRRFYGGTEIKMIDFPEAVTDGLILKSNGGLYYTETPSGILECKARGIFRKKNISPCAGDRVKIEEITDGTGIISEIYSRKNNIIRPPFSNLDCIVFVISTCEPEPNFTLLDKFIAIAEYKDIISMIAVTKCDLLLNDEIKAVYANSGVEIFNIDYDIHQTYYNLYDKLAGKISMFTGNTGVGKSTLLNHFDSRFKIETGEISKKLGRGRHTTRHVELYKLNNGGYIADTPGFSTFETSKYDIIFKDKLELCFREFKPYLGKCHFQGCSHTKEKGCVIISAVEKGDIPKSRHNSYIGMYEEAKLIKEWEVKDKL